MNVYQTCIPVFSLKEIFATDIMVLGSNASMNSPLAEVALKSGLLATEDSVEAGRDCLQEDLNCFNMEKRKLKMLIFEEKATMMAMSICLADMKKKLATFKIKQMVLAKSNVNLVFSARQEGAHSARTRNRFIKAHSIIYLGIALHGENAIVSYC